MSAAVRAAVSDAVRPSVRVRVHDRAMNASGARRLDTGGRLALDWTRLRTRPDHCATADGWQLVDEPVRDLRQILDAVGFEQPADAACEARLRRLVGIAAEDDLAARIVVQRLLPGLLAVVRRRRGQSDHVFEELLGAVWIAIRTFNPARSPRSIAASLIADADYAAFRAAARRRSAEEWPTDLDFDARPDVAEPSSYEQLAEVLADAEAAGVDAADLDLVRMLLAAPTANHLAEVMQITPRTIRNRRARAVAKLRDATLAA